MTDAAMAVTERTVERFAESYLRSLGADIVKDERQWTVSLPSDAETELELDETVVEIAGDLEETSDDALTIAPESSFVDRLIEEAAARQPTGTLALTSEHWEIQPPSWITAGPLEITDQTFTPYYDRRALCALFHIGIETVSEYQTEKLRAVAIDLVDREERPQLADSYLDLTESGTHERITAGLSIDEQSIASGLEHARKCVKNEIGPTIQAIREQASHAAETEFDEYRQLVRQQRNELSDQIDRTIERLTEVNEAIDTTGEQNDRVHALRRRKQLRSKVDDLRSEVTDLTTKIENGFPKKHEAIRDRHPLTIPIHPVTATVVSYERGDLTLTLRVEDASKAVSYPYAVGIGVTNSPTCARCGQDITSTNPLTLDSQQFIGSACCADTW